MGESGSGEGSDCRRSGVWSWAVLCRFGDISKWLEWLGIALRELIRLRLRLRLGPRLRLRRLCDRSLEYVRGREAGRGVLLRGEARRCPIVGHLHLHAMEGPGEVER